VKTDYDAVIVGGGHNGLVCAFYLARAGMRVRICEAHSEVGGAAVTEEFHPGYRNSVASYTVSLLQPRIIAEMGLAERGLRVVNRPVANFLPLSERPGDYLLMGGGPERRTPRRCPAISPRSTRSPTCSARWRSRSRRAPTAGAG
jgi:phytoene dehydrogenase-like protein